MKLKSKISFLSLGLLSSSFAAIFLCWAVYTFSLSQNALSSIEVYREAIKALQSNYYDVSTVVKALSKRNITDCSKEDKNNSYYDSIKCLINKINDPYTKFLSPEEARKELRRIKRTTFGLGISLDVLNPSLIAKVQSGSPAEKAGIKPGDQIISINGAPVEYITESEINDLLSNSSSKNKVSLDLKRKYTYFSAIIEVEEVSTSSVRGKILQNNIAYIRIDDLLPNNAFSELEIKLKDKNVQNTKGLILDLRGNKGGLLKNAINISDDLMNEGKIVIIKSFKGQEVLIAKPGSLYDKPIVLLIDRHTASASEVIAAALQDNRKAVLIGQISYGKGMIQKIHSLSDGSLLHITVNKFFTPNGKEINRVGIRPNIISTEPNDQLSKAIQILEGKMKVSNY